MRTTDKQINAGKELVADLLSKLTPGPWASNTPPSSTFTIVEAGHLNVGPFRFSGGVLREA